MCLCVRTFLSSDSRIPRVKWRQMAWTRDRGLLKLESGKKTVPAEFCSIMCSDSVPGFLKNEDLSLKNDQRL